MNIHSCLQIKLNKESVLVDVFKNKIQKMLDSAREQSMEKKNELGGTSRVWSPGYLLRCPWARHWIVVGCLFHPCLSTEVLRNSWWAGGCISNACPFTISICVTVMFRWQRLSYVTSTTSLFGLKKKEKQQKKKSRTCLTFSLSLFFFTI